MQTTQSLKVKWKFLRPFEFKGSRIASQQDLDSRWFPTDDPELVQFFSQNGEPICELMTVVNESTTDKKVRNLKSSDAE